MGRPRGEWPAALALLLHAALSSFAEAHSHLVCYAFFGPVQDLGYTYSQNLARAWSDEVLGTQSRFVENVFFLSQARQHEVMDDFMASGCGLVVLGSDGLEDLAVEYALRFPGQRFACVACNIDLPNVGNLFVRFYQGSYVAGVLTAMQPNVHKVGYVGSVYTPDPLQRKNAFALGMQSVNASLQLLVSHTGSWYDPRAERIAATRLVVQHGVDILVYDSDSAEVIIVAKELGRRSIGVKVDGTALHGDSNLMSILPQWHELFMQIINASRGDAAAWALYKDRDLFVGFERDALSTGTFSTWASASSRLKVKEQRRFFEQGGDIWCRSFEIACPRRPASDVQLGDVPCEGRTVVAPNASAGERCLSDEEVRGMTWLLKDGVVDFGLLATSGQCAPGHRMNPLFDAVCEPCSPGRAASQVDALTCAPCEPGYFVGTGKATKCAFCPPGTFSNTTGSSECAACPLGFTSEAAAASCSPCPVGSFGSSPGICSSCPRGTFVSNGGATACSLCGKGRYTAAFGAAGCQRCPPGYATGAVGGHGLEACEACPRGTYSSSSGSSSCVHCSAGFTTLDIISTNASACICSSGQYLPLGGDACRPCPGGMTCPDGSREEGYTQLAGAAPSAPYPVLDPGFWSSAEDPLSVFECASRERCLGGRPGRSCAPGLGSQACSHCGAGRVWDGVRCARCLPMESAALVFPTTPALFAPLIIAALYLFRRSGYERWHNWRNCLSVLLFNIITLLQVINVMGGMNLNYPKDLIKHFDTWRALSDAGALFRVECIGVVSLTDRIALKMATPAVLFALFVETWLISKILSKLQGGRNLAMSSDGLLNCYFSLLYTFFTGICASAFTIFRCTPNPNMLKTVKDDRSITCYESEWLGMLGLSLGFVALWCAGFVVLCVWAIWQSPKRFPDPAFRCRFKFLFLKYRNDRHWWSMVFLAKNLSVNFMFLISTDHPTFQIYWVAGVIFAYTSVTIMYMPWRHLWANVLDIGGHMGTLVTASTLTWFAARMRDGPSHDNDIIIIHELASFSSVPIVVVAALYTVLWGRGDADQELHDEQTDLLLRVYQALGRVSLEDFRLRYSRMSDWDRYFLLQAKDVVQQDFLSIRARSGYTLHATEVKELVGPGAILSRVVPAPDDAWPASDAERRTSSGDRDRHKRMCRTSPAALRGDDDDSRLFSNILSNAGSTVEALDLATAAARHWRPPGAPYAAGGPQHGPLAEGTATSPTCGRTKSPAQ